MGKQPKQKAASPIFFYPKLVSRSYIMTRFMHYFYV